MEKLNKQKNHAPQNVNVENILEDLVKFNTVNDLENSRIIDYLENYLKALGFKTEYKTKCLVMSIGASPILSFLGHTDVVTIDGTWNYPAFSLTKTEKKLIGRGAADMKGGIAAFLKALSLIDLKGLKHGIRVCFTYGEEINFGGIKELVKQGIKFCKYSLIGEPTDNYPCIGSKGLLEYELTFKGKAVHSSQPVTNECSNENCVMFLNEVLKLNDIFKKEKCNLYDVPNNTITIGQIVGGTGINITSALTKVLLSFRITKNAKDIEFIKNYIDNLCEKIPNVSYKILEELPPFYNEKPITSFYEEISGKSRKPFYAISEASFLNNSRLILGPGPLTAHQKDEYILKSSLNQTVEIYKKIIEKLCY